MGDFKHPANMGLVDWL